VGEFESDGHLFTCVTDRYASALHVSGKSEWSLRGTRWSSGPGTIDVKVPGEVFTEHARDGVRRFQVVLFDTRIVDEARTALDCMASPPTDNALRSNDPRVAPLAAFHHALLRATHLLRSLRRRPARHYARCANSRRSIESPRARAAGGRSR